ncbi:MAG: DUF434 domain-containing protein [Planctomycetota bacterium]
MPDKRTHRGPHPSDVKLFASSNIAALRLGLADYSFLLTKGYAEKSTLKLVGDKFSLTERQRLAIMRSACSDQQLASRQEREIEVGAVAGRRVAIDGYNVLITVEAAMSDAVIFKGRDGCFRDLASIHGTYRIEAAMSDAVIFKGRDGCFRDLASIHGTYRKVTETIPAVRLIGQFLHEVGVTDCLWLLDSPVSNSGRLKTLIGKLAGENGWNWEIELLISPDAKLVKSDLTVVSSDGVVLDRCKSWVNLARAIIEEKIPDAWLVDMS